ncbi:hypothetical protein AGDE_16692 [Angomonas deanei]|nr:hypothetical protein AGDE_16692 [Angomonas deanei]|eukprot:EPY16608.1 hypothetical protein AGDE_16692 [Angomonas deanei]
MGNKTDDDDDDGRSTGRSKELTPEEKLRKELNLKIRRLKKEVLEVNNKIDLQNQRMEDKRRLRTLKREQNEKNELKLRRQLKKLRAENEELTKKHIKVFGEDGDADVLSGGVYYFVAQAERQLKREQEKLKETKAAVRELKRKDKRAEHTLEEEHKKRSEQRQQSIVNENIYTRAGADKKIKQLKKSIEQTKITNENFSKKCEELQRQVDDEGCNINVKENAELRKNFEDNEKEITRLRNAIHVYSNAVAGNSPRKSNAGPTNAVRTNENEEFMAFYLQEKQNWSPR